MTPEQFRRRRRVSGSSGTEVVANLVASKQPGEVITFEELVAALDDGAERRHSVADARNAASRACVRLLKGQSRALVSIQTVGYRVARADEHRVLATRRRERADTQLRRGLQTLQNVRWEEMDQAAQEAHRGQLMVISALYEQQRAYESRLAKIERTLRGFSSGGKPPGSP